jgi:hypothetical protein
MTTLTSHTRSDYDAAEFGEFADTVARELWQIASGRTDATQSTLLAQAHEFLNAIADQLQQPYFSHPAVRLPMAIRFAEAVEHGLEQTGDRTARERQQVSEAFAFLADRVEEISSGRANTREVEQIADLFDRLGAVAMEARQTSPRGATSRSWATA